MPILISAHNDTSTGLDYLGSKVKAYPLALPSLFRYIPPAVPKAKVYIVSFRSHNDDTLSKFIVLADNMKSAIEKAW